MTAVQRPWAADLLHYWFRTLRPADWFGGSAEVDERLRQRFARRLAGFARQPAVPFLADPQTALAAVLLFDQLPRNLFRGQARAFASDPLARVIAKGALARGWHRKLPMNARAFLGMPLMHSERIADQRASLRYFRAMPANLRFARDHWRMIARFGRFPHRNDALSRRSTPAERAAVAAGNAW